MNPLKLALNSVLMGSFLVLGVAFQAAVAGQEAYVPKAKITPLTQKALPNVENREVIIQRMELPAGYLGGRHIHTGPVFVYVVQGELMVDVDGLGKQVIKAGELYEEPINRVMQGRNMHASEPLTIVIFQVGEPGQPMMIKAD